MTLELLISTIDDGIDSVAQLVLPPRDGVRYLVSWQHSLESDRKEVPETLIRDDITVMHLGGCGLSRNRNNCLAHATGDILLIADDDCRYTPERLDAVVDTFERNRSLALATFRMESQHNNKTYPEREFNLAKPPKGYYVTSFEIAIRREAIGVLRFDERFGLGAPVFQCCEEELYVEQAVELGFNCRFFPVTVVRHDEPTTQQARAADPDVLAARGAYLWQSRRYHRTSLLRAILAAWRARGKGLTFRQALHHLYRGIALIRTQN